jgi:alkylation response protein AidB-like acyl-CoA dehydrogenase
LDVTLSREQQLISETAARLGAQHAISGVRDLPPTPGSTNQAWDALVQTGVVGLHGAGSAVASALVAEQLARQLCVAPYLGQGVLAHALVAELDESVRYCVLLRSDLSAFAEPDEDAVAFDAVGATHGLSVDAAGTVRRHSLAGTPTGLDLTRVTLAVPLAEGEWVGETDVPRAEALAMTMLAADQLGLMERALEMAVAYAGDRRQFARVIGANQALAHVLADAKVLVEASRSCVWHAAWALDALHTSAALEAARQAKAFCGSAAREVLEAAIQVHGGVAITWEHPLHLLLRRVLFDDQLFGSATRQLAAISRQRLDPEPVPTAAGHDGVSVPDPGDGLSFGDTWDEQFFRERLRVWLSLHAPKSLPTDGDARMAALHDWHRAMAAAGFVGVSFAEEYGGHGLTLMNDAILNDELAAAGAPPGPAINHITNAIRLFGTEEQKRTYLPGMLDCSVRWCQGFSEPAAGSDLASLATRGILFEHDGVPSYRIDGQKLWTSEAVWADWCLLLLRTEAGNPAKAKQHQQLSMLMVPMAGSGVQDTPGLEVRPVVTAYGSSEFAEVFFTGAVVPATQLLGNPGDGWAIAMALLGFERGPADMGWTARLARQLSIAEARIRSGELAATQSQREALAGAWVELEALRLQVLRSTSQRLDGSAPGPEGSLDKLLMTRAEQRLLHVLQDLAGAEGVLEESDLFQSYLWSRAQAIFGGTQQIQRDIVAQRVLGLPRPGS